MDINADEDSSRIYVGEDPSKIKEPLSRILTCCVIATKSNTDFGFAVTESKNVKYNLLERELKKKYAQGTYKYIRGSMSATGTKLDKESGYVSGGIIVLNIYRGEDDDGKLPEDSKLRKVLEATSITVNKNVDIPVSYLKEINNPAAEQRGIGN